MPTPRTWRGRAFLGSSLDGFIAGPGGDLTFLESEPGAGLHRATPQSVPAFEWETFFPSIDTLVMGRNTYEAVSSFDEWPYPGTRVIVLSSTLDAAQPNVTVAPSIEALVTMLNTVGAEEVYVDGGVTVQAFLERGLLDELTISWLPLAIGDGTRLFSGNAKATFAVRGSHVTPDGLARVTYDVVH